MIRWLEWRCDIVCVFFLFLSINTYNSMYMVRIRGILAAMDVFSDHVLVGVSILLSMFGVFINLLPLGNKLFLVLPGDECKNSLSWKRNPIIYMTLFCFSTQELMRDIYEVLYASTITTNGVCFPVPFGLHAKISTWTIYSL